MDVVAALQAADPQFYWSPKIAVEDVVGKGKSVFCIEPIGEGETLIRVPPTMLVNIDTVAPNEDLETHELLALELLRLRAKSDAWVESMPADFKFLPVEWPTSEQAQLPERYLKTVRNQAKAIRAFKEKCALEQSDALWSWLAVNSRCLYWERGGMTLAPGIDFINHTEPGQPVGLSVVKDTNGGMCVKTILSYKPSTELTFSYGPRENGFLLVEYGFTMEGNTWEFVDVTKYIEPLVTRCKGVLEDGGYYGDWTLGADALPSFGVEVALLAAQSPSPSPVIAFMNGLDDGRRFEEGTARLLDGVVKSALRDARVMHDAARNAQIRMLYEGYIHILTKA